MPRRTPLLMPHVIARRVQPLKLKNAFSGLLLPVEVEYVCRRSGERNRRLDWLRNHAKQLRAKGQSQYLKIEFVANQTFAEELYYLQRQNQEYQKRYTEKREVLRLA
jgi:hypothetical protein